MWTKVIPFLVVFLSSGTMHAQDTIKILPLGNSITQAENQGPNQYNSWRRPLFQRLDTLLDGHAIVDFIGSHNVVHPGVAHPNSDFDQDHEGHWGWRLDEIRDYLGYWIRMPNVGAPDMVLIHLGSNDCFQGESIQSSTQEMEEIIDTLRAFNPTVTLFIAQIIPSNYGDASCIDQWNTELVTIANEKNQSSSPIILVDQNSGFSASMDTYDDIHPNLNGETKMADRWYEAIEPVITDLTTSAYQLSPHQIDIFPNPSSSTLRISGNLASYSLRILDGSGLLIDELENSSSEVDYNMSNLPPGPIFLVIRHLANSHLWVEKIIKM